MSRDEANPADAEAEKRLEDIRASVAYFRKAVASSGVGSQPPTLYAEKYLSDVEFLLARFAPTPEPPQPAVLSDLERALDDDSAGRVERKPKRG